MRTPINLLIGKCEIKHLTVATVSRYFENIIRAWLLVSTMKGIVCSRRDLGFRTRD